MEEQCWCEECKSKIRKIFWGGTDRESTLLELGHCHHPKEVKVCKWCEAWKEFHNQPISPLPYIPGYLSIIVAARYLITRGQEMKECPECHRQL